MNYTLKTFSNVVVSLKMETEQATLECENSIIIFEDKVDSLDYSKVKTSTIYENSGNSSDVTYGSTNGKGYICTLYQVDNGELKCLQSKEDTEGESSIDNQLPHCQSSVLKGGLVYCMKCDEDYYIEDGKCKELSNCIKSVPGKCVECRDGFIISNGECKQVEGCKKKINGVCVQCEGECAKELVNDDCKSSYDDYCYVCDGKKSVNGECQEIENAKVMTTDHVVECKEGFYNKDDTCGQCIDHCNECYNGNTCNTCQDGYMLNKDKTECISMKCTTNDGKCTECTDSNDQLNENKRCYSKIEGCTHSNEGICMECKEGSIMEGTTCTTDDGCEESNNNICKKCKSGYYLESGKCSPCDENCLECAITSTQCTQCSQGKYLTENNKCEGVDEGEKGEEYSGEGYCVKCKDGYWKDDIECYPCKSDCFTCNDNSTCSSCYEGYSLTFDGECIKITEVEGCKVNDTNDECIECMDGYFLFNKECVKCPSNCMTCSDNSTCTSCGYDNVLTEVECVEMKSISNCTTALKGKCVECSSCINQIKKEQNVRVK